MTLISAGPRLGFLLAKRKTMRFALRVYLRVNSETFNPGETQVSRKPGCDLSTGRHISEVGRAWHLRLASGNAPAILWREASGRLSTGSNLLSGRATGVNVPGGHAEYPFKM